MACLAPLTNAPKAGAVRSVRYTFHGSTGAARLDLDFDQQDRFLHSESSAPWTDINYNRCPQCPLTDSATCPAASALAAVLPEFGGRVSHEKVVVEVETANRTILTRTTLQSGLASLMGLVLATSGCPRTEFLRSMAHFHLPFADEEETMFRAFSTWLLEAYARRRLHGSKEAMNLDGLKEAYGKLSQVNACLAERLRAFAARDAILNAVIVLDLFAQIAPANIDGELEDIAQALGL